MSEIEELRRELHRAETMNEALVDAGKAVVAERDALRIQNEHLDDRNRWRWPQERDARLKAEAENQRLRDVLEQLAALPLGVGPYSNIQGFARAALDASPTGISRGQHPEDVYPTERAEAS